jgi:hypothetical protein
MRSDGTTRVAQELKVSLEADFAGSDCLVAYMVPSTQGVIDVVSQVLRRQHGVIVVAPSFPGSTAPVQLLARLRSDESAKPRIILIFSDQLVSPEIATIPVDVDGSISYVSGLEAVLYARYGYMLRAVLASGVETAAAPGTVEEVLALLDRYFAACELLGDAWLMRARQVERERGMRLREAKMRLRYFQSAVFYAYRERPLDQVGLTALRRVDQTIQYLTDREP